MGKKTQHKEINLFMAAQHARFLFLPLCPTLWVHPDLKYYSLHQIKQNIDFNWNTYWPLLDWRASLKQCILIFPSSSWPRCKIVDQLRIPGRWCQWLTVQNDDLHTWPDHSRLPAVLSAKQILCIKPGSSVVSYSIDRNPQKSLLWKLQ